MSGLTPQRLGEDVRLTHARLHCPKRMLDCFTPAISRERLGESGHPYS